jgi:hypothetical protein
MNKEVIFSLLYAIYQIIAMFGLGSFVNRRFFLKDRQVNTALFLSLGIAVGYSLYAMLFYFMYCFVKEPGLWMIVILFLPGLLLGSAGYVRVLASARENYKNFLKNNSTIKIATIVIVLPLLLLYVLLFMDTVVPVKLGDAITGYLETSRWIYHNGFTTFDPYNAKYSLMPRMTETIYSLSFAINSEMPAKCVDAFLATSMLILVYGYAHTYMNRTLSFYMAISFMTLTSFMWLFGGGKIDCPSQFVMVGSMVLLSFNEKGFSQKITVLSGFLLCIALASKLTNYLLAPLYFGYLVYIMSRLKASDIVKLLFSLAAVAVVVILPHFIIDYIWTGNPFDPFKNPLFHSRFLIDEHHHSDSTFTPWKDSLLFPYGIFLKNKLPLLMLIGLILFVINWKKLSKDRKMLLVISILELALWIAILKESWLNQRFIYALIVTFLLCAFTGFTFYYDKHKLLRIAMYLFVFFTLVFWANDYRRFGKYAKFIVGKESRRDWQDEFNARSANLLEDVAPYLSDTSKMMMYKGGVIFNVPYQAEKYVSTEQDRLLLEQAPDKDAFLKKNHYRYLFHGLKDLDVNESPAWVRTRVFMQKPDGIVFIR